MLIRKGFTLVELLTVTAVIGLLMGIMLPVLGRARLLAKVTVTNSDLRQIAIALEAYGMDHDNKFPPVRWDCGNKDNFYQLPRELSKGGYLGEGDSSRGVSANIIDRFNPPYTYKYMAPGPQFGNNDMPFDNLLLYVPDGFPHNERDSGQFYDDPRQSPVTWVVFSIGPHYDSHTLRQDNYPVPSKTWFDPDRRRGVVTRIRLKNAVHVGSFEQ